MEKVECSGQWISGSGGHRVHQFCGRPATWWHPDDVFAYCDQHFPKHEVDFYLRFDEAKKREDGN